MGRDCDRSRRSHFRCTPAPSAPAEGPRPWPRLPARHERPAAAGPSWACCTPARAGGCPRPVLCQYDVSWSACLALIRRLALFGLDRVERRRQAPGLEDDLVANDLRLCQFDVLDVDDAIDLAEVIGELGNLVEL